MRHTSGHGSSHTFLTAEFVNALVEDREPAIDCLRVAAMTVPESFPSSPPSATESRWRFPQFDPAT